MKQIPVLLGLFCLLLALTACGKGESAKSGDTKASASLQTETSERVITLVDLANCDGKNGHPAWIAYDGVVYDVSAVPAWKGGSHKGFQCGQDVTEFIKSSPHGNKVIASLKRVGVLKI